MKPKGVIFTAEEVVAALAGRKTQFRVPVKFDMNALDSKMKVCGKMLFKPDEAWVDGKGSGDEYLHVPIRHPDNSNGDDWWFSTRIFAPWKSGDRFGIKETFCIESNYLTGSPHAPPFTDGRPVNWVDDHDFGGRYWQQCHYRATDPTPDLDIGEPDPGVRWQGGLCMPNWAIWRTALIRDVRVHRVKEITEADARVCGVDGGCANCGESSIEKVCGCDNPEPLYVDAFIGDWDSRYAKRGNGWAANGFVWAVTFDLEGGR